MAVKIATLRLKPVKNGSKITIRAVMTENNHEILRSNFFGITLHS